MRLTRAVALLGFLLFFCSRAPAQIDTVTVGLFVTDLYDLNLAEKSYRADFWLWFNYADSTLRPQETLELPTARALDRRLAYVENVGGVQWATQKINAEFKQDWQLADFPFDTQKLRIVLEESDRNAAALHYRADTANTKYYEAIRLPNWEVVDFRIVADTVHYPTTYGDPSLSGGSSYARATAEFTLRRQSRGLFFTLFTGVYVAFFISVLVFFIDPVDVDPRFGLSVGGLFAAVGNKYIVDSILPQSTSFTLVDKIHVLTYVFLLVCIVVSVISLRVWKNGRVGASKRLDRVAFFTVTILYVALNLLFIL